MVETKRVNIRVSPEVYDWFKMRSERTGVPYGHLMFLALEQYIQQNQAINDLPRMVNELKSLSNLNNRKGKPICPKCNGEESPNSVEHEKGDLWKCHECGTVFRS